MSFYIFHRHRVCLVDHVDLSLVDHVDLICSLYSWWEGFGSSFLATLPLGFNCGFISTSTCESSIGVQLLRLPCRACVCLCQGQVWRWSICLGHRGSGSTRYSGELAARAAGNIVLQKGMATSTGQYAPVFLPGATPSLTEKPGRPQSTGSQRVRHYQSNPACTDARLFFTCGRFVLMFGKNNTVFEV